MIQAFYYFYRDLFEYTGFICGKFMKISKILLQVFLYVFSLT